MKTVCGVTPRSVKETAFRPTRSASTEGPVSVSRLESQLLNKPADVAYALEACACLTMKSFMAMIFFSSLAEKPFSRKTELLSARRRIIFGLTFPLPALHSLS